MGSDFELVVVDEEEITARKHLQAAVEEIERIEELLTEFKPTSQTSALNQAAGLAPVTVDEEVYQLVKRCLNLSHLSQGAFDCTAGALKKLYTFKGGDNALPTSEAVNSVLKYVGYQHVELLSDNRVFLTKENMRIGFGAIGKGYAADKAKELLVSRGVQNGVINASGDLTAWGKQPDGSAWRVGITDPFSPRTTKFWLPVQNASVATSGNYEQYFEHNGKRYSHNLDPRTGLPTRYLASVTVISPMAELSDALATVVTVMGIDVGLHFIDQLPQTYCLLIDENNRVHTSKALKLETHA
jgi:thiamine biosynthesis lipoprotein